jgi:hypothetical protein
MEADMASRDQKRKGRLSRGRTRKPAYLGTVAVVTVVVALLALALWQSGVFAQAPEPTRDESLDPSAPLANAGRPLSGGHDMALIPERTPAPRPAPADQPVARLALSSQDHDFGSIQSHWDLTHVFLVHNLGDADLLLGSLVTSCGCTVAHLTSAVIPPGERADLTVTFDADFHPTQGDVVRLVWFATNDPTQPWVELRLTARLP